MRAARKSSRSKNSITITKFAFIAQWGVPAHNAIGRANSTNFTLTVLVRKGYVIVNYKLPLTDFLTGCKHVVFLLEDRLRDPVYTRTKLKRDIAVTNSSRQLKELKKKIDNLQKEINITINATDLGAMYSFRQIVQMYVTGKNIFEASALTQWHPIVLHNPTVAQLCLTVHIFRFAGGRWSLQLRSSL